MKTNSLLLVAALLFSLSAPAQTFSIEPIPAAANRVGAPSTIENGGTADRTQAVCSAYGSSRYQYIQSVVYNSLSRFSGPDAGGYFDGVAANVTPATAPRCGITQIWITPAFQLTVSTQYWNVYIDFNQNGSFADAGERLMSNYQTTTANMFSVRFGVPAGALLGKARLRIMMSSAPMSTACGYVGGGEVEDYPVNITTAATLYAPSALGAYNLTPHTADLSWAGQAYASYYQVQYKPSGFSTWTSATVTTQGNPLLKLTGLVSGWRYQWQVRSVDACGTVGPWTAINYFDIPSARSGGAASPGGIVDLYPNPAADVLHLTLAAEADGNTPTVTDVIVYDLRGAKVEQVRYDGNGTLHLDGLTPGLYTATVLGGSAPANVRFVKQ